MFPLSCGTKEGEADHFVDQTKNYRKKKIAFGLCGCRKTFLKSLFLALIFKNSDLKCLSAITFRDKFFLPAFFSPGFSN